MPDLMGAAEAVCAARGWVVLEDLTETRSGWATPVLKVERLGVPAVLRTGVEQRSFDSLQAMSSSGVTSALLDSGTENGVSWVLLEWVDGIPLDLADLVDVSVFRSVTAELLDAMKDLYVHPAPDAARDAALEVARDLEVALLQTTHMPKSLPLLHTVPRDHWGTGVHLHGDLLPSNVIRTPTGQLRVYDLEGGFGPAELDVGWWISGQYVALEATTGDLDAIIDGISSTLDDTVAAATWLNAKRLHAWTAYALCEAANALRRQGDEWAHYRAVAHAGGQIFQRGVKLVVTRPGRNDPCPCGSGRRYKQCCGGSTPS